MTDERNVTPAEDAILRAAAVRGGKVVAKGRMTDELPLPDIGPKMYLPTEVESMLHAYGKACADAATERCAGICDEAARILGSTAALAHGSSAQIMRSKAWAIGLCAKAMRQADVPEADFVDMDAIRKGK